MNQKFLFLTVLSISFAFKALAQTQKIDSGSIGVFPYVEQMPEFPGGQGDLMKFLQENIEYPDDARDASIEGKVVAKFIVNEDGSISDVTILRGIYPSCDSEVIRVISKMPRWKSGVQNGKEVKVYFTLPVTFKLSEVDFTKPNITLPSYPAGEDSLASFINRNIQYPKLAKKNHMQGTVTLSFNVDSLGNVRDITVYKSVGNGCDEEAIRILKLIPHWIPGTKGGEAVKMPYYINVEFWLNEEK